MDPETIKEARRLLRDLIFKGQASTQLGKTIAPKDESLVTLIERVAARRVEEPEALPAVEGYQLKGTHHVREKERPDQGRSNPVERCGGVGDGSAGDPNT